MIQYEINFIVDPVLSGDEIEMTAKTYEDMLKDAGASIVFVDSMGLKQLAYPIKKRTSGVYFNIEYQISSGKFNQKLELSLKRDERILRYLNVKLDKYGIKYNQDKRDGKIGVKKKTSKEKVSIQPIAKTKKGNNSQIISSEEE